MKGYTRSGAPLGVLPRQEPGNPHTKAKQQTPALCAFTSDRQEAEDLDVSRADLMPIHPVLPSKAGFKGSL